MSKSREFRRISWRNGRYLLEYVAFRLLFCIWQALPMRHCVTLAEVLGWSIHRLLPRKFTRYEVARSNLQQAFGDRYSDRELDQVIERMWVHLFRLLAEISQLTRKMRLHNIYDVIEFRNKSEAVRSFCAGRPAIMLGGHLGNWEVAISAFGLIGFHCGAVARELENPYLNRWFLKFREATGHSVISKKGCFDGIIERLESGGSIAMMGDQNAGSGGVFVDFFGRPASTPKTVALMALEYKALICVGYARRLEHVRADWVRFELACEEVIDPVEIEKESDDPIREITQRYTAALERAIRRAPEQYFWIHRRWKSVPKAKRYRRAAESAPVAAQLHKKAG